MKTRYFNEISMAVVALIFSITAHAQEVKTIANINAATETAYFNFTTGKQVPTASDEWDIAFNRTTVLINGGSSGSGKAQAALLKETSFDSVTQRPTAGFKADTESEKAIPTGSGNGWYEYDMGDHSINPIPGRVLVIRTTAGDYVKLEILSYYNKATHDSANYSFKYSFLK
ncbi:HmuY family protein [Parapedobacter soli]|uniref:HmuY family protein n=1 Tax=Parapedobacter soli TaxID=416955 RepID=UPI0021C7C934|nr:HmuY family protein [Parapedobacter soli]